MKKIKLKSVEFYITNVCNLTCEGCNRFNNLKFKGWQDWDDYADVYTQWGEHVDLDKIVILGGEPLLNPTLIQWIRGLRSIWGRYSGNRHGHIPIQILTNGTRLGYYPDLYDVCSENSAWIGVSMHHDAYKDELFENIHKFFKGIRYKVYESSTGNAGTTGGHYSFESDNVKVGVYRQDTFTQNSLRINPVGDITLYNNNPEIAHAACSFAQHKVYHFIKGKLYKCGPVALFPELDNQFKLDIPSEDQTLVHSYQPYTVDNIEQFKNNFFEHIDAVLPQCKFCPEHFEFHELKFMPKKAINIEK